MILPASGREINANMYTGKITKGENYLLNWEWWENFNDPLLVELLKQAIDNSFDLQVAGMKIEEVQNYADSVNRKYLPYIRSGFGHRTSKFLFASVRGEDFEYNSNNNKAWHMLYLPVRASYEIDIWGKNRTEKNFFLENKDLYAFEKRLITIATVAEVSSLYFNILKNEKLLELYGEITELKREQLEISKEKFVMELIPKAEVIEAEKQLNKSEEQIITLKAVNKELKNNLSMLVFGDKEKTDIKYAVNQDVKPFYDETLEITTDKIAYRPDILVAEKQIKMAKLDAEAVKKELFPSLVLNGNFIYVLERLNDYFTAEAAGFSLGGEVLFNLFEKGRNMSELKAKKNIYRQMLKNYEKTIVTSINEVNNTLFYLKSSLKNYENAQKITKLDSENMDIQKQKLDMNLITYSDYIESRQNFIETVMTECETKTQCLIHTISLYKALGGNV